MATPATIFRSDSAFVTIGIAALRHFLLVCAAQMRDALQHFYQDFAPGWRFSLRCNIGKNGFGTPLLTFATIYMQKSYALMPGAT